ncbi:MAG TPA: response regulator [Fimbriiglobus sp.]|jgi:CheY-like chemotaxis protein|nr:response regulator [Fimbriiglobus sp.]
MASVLVVEDSPVQAKYLEHLLTVCGHRVRLAANGVEALAALRESVPDLVLTDMQMPVMNGLELVAAARTEYPGLPVILTTGAGSEELAVQALRAGAASYIPKPNLAREAGPLLEEVLTVADSQRKHALFLGRMTRVEHSFALESDPDLVPEVVGHVEALMRQMELFDPSDRVRIGVGVHEATVNAMVHGNLEVGSDLKGGDWQAYHALIRERSKQEPYSNRRVWVTVRADRTPRLELVVRDEGAGFDPRALPDPTDPLNWEKASGRGLLLIRTFFDTVTHNTTGNEITMIKGQPASEPEA